MSESVRRRSIEDRLGAASKQLILNQGSCTGIDTVRFDAGGIDGQRLNKLRERLGLSRDDMVVGFTGRLVRDKGIIELVEAFKALKADVPRLKLLLVGMFEQRDALPGDLVKQISDDADIIHTGYVDYNEIEYYYSLMDIYVLQKTLS